MQYKLNNAPFNVDIAHKIIDVNYPPGFFKVAANRAAIGIVEEPDTPLTVQQIADTAAGKISENIAKLWQAAHDYEYAEINGMAVGLLVLGVLQTKPKALAVQTWSKSIWTLYYTRKALVTDELDPSFQNFSSCGPIPYSIPELMAELAI